MKPIVSLMLAGFACAMLSAAPARSQDASAYRHAAGQAATDYRGALAECRSDSGNARQLCLQQAKVTRAQAELDAAEQYRNTPRAIERARTALANAEYGLSRARCADMTGDDKNNCLRDAKAAQLAALDDARSGARMAAAGTAATTTRGENCDQMSVTDKAACMARNTAGATRGAVADTAITTRVKADLVRAPELKAMDVHVETVKGVVMLSGFVESQREADKAVAVARGVEGVTDVKSALKVK